MKLPSDRCSFYPSRQEYSHLFRWEMNCLNVFYVIIIVQTNKKSKVTKLKDVKSEISEEILPEVAQEISPCYIKMVRHMDGDEVKEWTLKIIDLIVGTKISVLFDIKKQSKADPSKFAFSIQLVDEYTTEELLEEVTNIAGMLRKDKYQVSFELKEL